jgi:L-ascorbate metabolism protein UlaG (beta-lactamase superfamily)
MELHQLVTVVVSNRLQSNLRTTTTVTDSVDDEILFGVKKVAWVERFNFDDIRVTQGEIVEWSTLLDPGVQARAYTWILEDPNTKMLNRYNGTFNNVES